ncbi:hypothetical protein P691DRAFT_805702 [Macrolepiota fuliginosa MF-IS2]|uniref:Uncharacterized protein n=1 Tax=Macrolepiota fuliginosa MF-IS2 TaxID=1400762 RepID=A0A9P5X6E2_9AGAR|nr:hypothetical protein P691DRAFT_805702 [Macrolepiota fuliginosa MF-IS2]
MSGQLPIQFLSLTQDERYEIPPSERPIDHPALGDRIPFTLRSGQMAAFVAMMSPEQQEAFEVKVAQQQEELRLWDRRNERRMTNSVRA